MCLGRISQAGPGLDRAHSPATDLARAALEVRVAQRYPGCHRERAGGRQAGEQVLLAQKQRDLFGGAFRVLVFNMFHSKICMSWPHVPRAPAKCIARAANSERPSWMLHCPTDCVGHERCASTPSPPSPAGLGSASAPPIGASGWRGWSRSAKVIRQSSRRGSGTWCRRPSRAGGVMGQADVFGCVAGRVAFGWFWAGEGYYEKGESKKGCSG